MLRITGNIVIPDSELELGAIRSQGAGGQNVNKVASAIHLRFNIPSSSLPEAVKQQLMQLNDRRISGDGVLVIKAQRFRTQEKNRADALSRLQSLVRSVLVTRRKRVPTRATAASRARRLDSKTRRGQHKRLRGKVTGEE
ncbi:MAG: alternative ribosome rescue aminoacyl-tRNA hydrolase ArfB [Gammaproteobacteria bacterium]|nr:alternative ribosome rescue aminoacyl-tRNA hydrolase ArfB [Gammaproteobacteria bacterium]